MILPTTSHSHRSRAEAHSGEGYPTGLCFPNWSFQPAMRQSRGSNRLHRSFSLIRDNRCLITIEKAKIVG